MKSFKRSGKSPQLRVNDVKEPKNKGCLSCSHHQKTVVEKVSWYLLIKPIPPTFFGQSAPAPGAEKAKGRRKTRRPAPKTILDQDIPGVETEWEKITSDSNFGFGGGLYYHPGKRSTISTITPFCNAFLFFLRSFTSRSVESAAETQFETRTMSRHVFNTWMRWDWDFHKLGYPQFAGWFIMENSMKNWSG